MVKYQESEWSQWHKRLIGHDIVEYETRKKKIKRGIYDKYKPNPSELELIACMFHPDFLYPENDGGAV